ncbi:MAG: hypothetical protein AAF432_00315, partial [Planctomycetota bacterium]
IPDSRFLVPNRKTHLLYGPHRTALWNHPDDGLVDRDAARRWHATPVFDAGLQECRIWLMDFLVTFEAMRREVDTIPSPSRMYFDTEQIPWPESGYPHDGGNTMPELFEAWLREGHAFMAPPFPDAAWHSGLNHRFVNYWKGEVWRRAQATLGKLYEQINLVWPDCKCGNYITSERYDGQHPARFARHTDDKPEHHWMESTSARDEPLSQPVLYRGSAAFNLDKVSSCIHSFGGNDPSICEPYFAMDGQGSQYLPTADVLDILRLKRVDTAIAWSNPNPSLDAWNQLVDNLDAIAEREARAA